MGGHVDQHMEAPGSEFPERPFQERPSQEKRDEEDDEAVGDIVQMMHILRDRRLRRSRVSLYPSTTAVHRTPNERRSGVRPMTKASQKLDRFLRPKATAPHSPCETISIRIAPIR